tara:strand:+ start:5878 stop:6606 length:729 start_codon:yes stop_codon:yes gene_type:complete
MKHGFYSDQEIPKSIAKHRKPIADYKTNSHGYRCPEWTPLPVGKKNVVILGCSHTFGEGLNDGEVWVDKLYNKIDKSRLRFWNLAQPGASADKVVRILYGCEKVLFPKIIIVCWPLWSRRERLDGYAQSLMSYDEKLKNENEHTDSNNFLKNVFFVEKFAEKTDATVFHCFAQDAYPIQGVNAYDQTTIKKCWPVWSKQKSNHKDRIRIDTPSLAKDGMHYGVEHHERFAELFYNHFRSKLK